MNNPYESLSDEQVVFWAVAELKAIHSLDKQRKIREQNYNWLMALVMKRGLTDKFSKEYEK